MRSCALPIMTFAFGNSERMVEIGTFGEYPAVLFALAGEGQYW